MKITPVTKIIPMHLHPLGFIECFVNLGANLDDLLANTEINRNMMASRSTKISYLQQDMLIENGLQLCNLPNLGLRVAALMDWSYHGSVGSIVSCSTRLKDAWNMFFHFLCTAQPACARREFERSFYVNKHWHIVEPIVGFNTFDKKPSVAQFELEFMLGIGLRICDLCGNKSVEDSRVNVSFAFPQPENMEPFLALPCDEIQFNQEETAISGHVHFVNQVWRPFRQHAYNKLVALCEKEQIQSESAMPISPRTRWHIGINYFEKALTLEDIAEELHMTPRTLTRMLAKEGTSFRSIFHEVRMTMTAYHLQKSDLSLESIAKLIGFSSVASLRRAIKNWSGDTLSRVRQGDNTPTEFAPMHATNFNSR